MLVHVTELQSIPLEMEIGKQTNRYLDIIKLDAYLVEFNITCSK